jgi:hypothetical protein
MALTSGTWATAHFTRRSKAAKCITCAPLYEEPQRPIRSAASVAPCPDVDTRPIFTVDGRYAHTVPIAPPSRIDPDHPAIREGVR